MPMELKKNVGKSSFFLIICALINALKICARVFKELFCFRHFLPADSWENREYAPFQEIYIIREREGVREIEEFFRRPFFLKLGMKSFFFTSWNGK